MPFSFWVFFSSSFSGGGKRARIIIRRAGTIFASCGLFLHLSSASARIDGFLCGGRIVFMFSLAKKVRSKPVEQLSLRGPMLSAHFGHGSAGAFSFFVGEGGRVFFPSF